MSEPSMRGWENPTAGERQRILRETRTLAMVGASANPARASNFVATYLLSSSSYEVWFVNPNATEILGRSAELRPASRILARGEYLYVSTLAAPGQGRILRIRLPANEP